VKLEQFIELVKTPSQTGEQHIPSIEKILSDYPYFQTAHLLYAKALHSSNHINYRNTLKKTAVVAGNRTVLYRLIQSPAQITKEVLSVAKEETKAQVKTEKQVSNVSITYDVVPTIKHETVHETQNPQPEIVQPDPDSYRDKIEEPETIKQESLDEVIMKPVLEAYVDTEVLKITEKESPETAEKSFSDWLKTLADHKPLPDNSLKKAEKQEARTENEPVKSVPKQKQQEIMEKLLNADLRMKRDPDKKFYEATEKSKVIENEELVTETLAKIYKLQGNNSKAIRAYEILSLKFPEKSAYFAALITEIKNSVK
jgi:hypothetical protein